MIIALPDYKLELRCIMNGKMLSFQNRDYCSHMTSWLLLTYDTGIKLTYDIVSVVDMCHCVYC